MSLTIHTAPQRTSGIPDTLRLDSRTLPHLQDRIALRIGLWLLLRSARSEAAWHTRRIRATRARLDAAQARREQDSLRALTLLPFH